MKRILPLALIVGLYVSMVAAVTRPANKPEATPQEIVSVEEFKKVCRHDKPVVFLFYAPWCGVCTRIKEPFATAAQKNPSVLMARINTDSKALKPIVDAFNVTAIPTIIARKEGFMNADQLSRLAESLTPPSSPKSK
jgi:protein disulfide-isomerase A5